MRRGGAGRVAELQAGAACSSITDVEGGKQAYRRIKWKRIAGMQNWDQKEKCVVPKAPQRRARMGQNQTERGLVQTMGRVIHSEKRDAPPAPRSARLRGATARQVPQNAARLGGG